MKKRFMKLAGIFMCAAAVVTLAAPAGVVKAAQPSAATKLEAVNEQETLGSAELMALTAVQPSADIRANDASDGGTLVFEDGVWYYEENGERVPDKYGIVAFDGGYFLVANGVVAQVSGLQEVGDYWFFVANGQVQTQYTGLAEYDGEWFYIVEGILLSEYSGVVPYDDSLFLISQGRICFEYSGLYQLSGYTGEASVLNGMWLFFANGQAQIQYTGLVLYDDAWFYIDAGTLDAQYNGYVKYDGSIFYVQNGMLTNNEYYMGLYYRSVNNRSAYASDISGVLSYINQYRSEAGVAPLALDEEVCIAASIRAQEMVDNNNLSNTRPNGGKGSDLLSELSIAWEVASEGVASGYVTSADLCSSWYSKPDYYGMMVDADYGRIGVGVAVDASGMKYWTLLFVD